MSFDISHLLGQWEYQPGQLMVRRFVGRDGVDKIQLRLDLGVLQMNAEGRPDGKRPLGHDSYYDFLRHRLVQHLDKTGGQDDDFVIDGDDCAKLQLEALQYHHRYICLLQLEDYSSAVRDTTRNLKVFDFVEEYAESDEMAWSLQQFRPQVLMLQTRSVASQHLKDEEFATAIQEIQAGIEQLREFYEDYSRHDLLAQSPEIAGLQHWLEEIERKRPLSRREQLERDLNEAVQHEDYEKAARVRDALKKLKPSD
jgi:hypothetical protein